MSADTTQPIGVFDSGYGGLTVLRSIVEELPQYDYIYLGDNARAPYGTRSFETVYAYTLSAVNWLFDKGCRLVILACNTASAKALRTIQQNDLPRIDSGRRVLGVIRPSVEAVGKLTQSGHVGVLGTPGTVKSESYPIEIYKLFPHLKVVQEACPMWVSLVENGEYNSEGADYFIKQHINRLLMSDSEIDSVILGCTHYPLLIPKIRQYLPESILLIPQGEIVAKSLADYLVRHPEIEIACSKNGHRQFFTTDSVELFDLHASEFFGQEITSVKTQLF